MGIVLFVCFLLSSSLYPSPAVDRYICKNAKKKSNNFFSFLNIFDENDMEMFGIMVGQNCSAQYAL